MTTIWPLGDHTIEPLPEHPMMRRVGEALMPLYPLLRKLHYDLSDDDSMPIVTLGLGEEFHLVSVRLLDEETLLIDLPVGELDQTPENLHALLEDNLRRTWLYRVDSVTKSVPGQVVVVIEYRLALEQLGQLPDRIVDGWINKVLSEGTLRDLNGRGGNI